MEKIQEKLGIKGKITIRGYKAGTLAKIEPLMKRLSRLLSDKSGHSKEIIALRHNIRSILIKGLIDEKITDNLIMVAANVGTDLIIQNLGAFFLGAPISNLSINYLAIGTGSTTPANTDTQLTTEVARSTVVDAQDIGFDELQLQAFLTDSNLANGTYYEAGAFIGGTSSLNSGIMFDHALFATPYVKVSGQDTTIQITISL